MESVVESVTQQVLFWKPHLLHGIRGSAYSLTLHVRAISARAWQLVLQMKSTLVYSASLMACFPLPTEQPGSLKGTCCFLILNLLQAYLGICLFLLLPSLAHLPVSSTCAAEKHCTLLENQAMTCTACWSSPALSLHAILYLSPFLTCSLQNVGVISDELEVASPGRQARVWKAADPFFSFSLRCCVDKDLTLPVVHSMTICDCLECMYSAILSECVWTPYVKRCIIHV